MAVLKKHRIKNPIAEAWFKKANAFLDGQPNDSKTLYVLTAGAPEIDNWVAYFNHLGWMPVFMRDFLHAEIEGIEKEVTVPAQWPELFDLSYAPPDIIPPRPRRLPPLPPLRFPPPREVGTDYFSMFAKHGRPIGRFEKEPPLGAPRPDGKLPPSLGEVIAKAKLWQRPTDDALRAHYGTRTGEP